MMEKLILKPPEGNNQLPKKPTYNKKLEDLREYQNKRSIYFFLSVFQ